MLKAHRQILEDKDGSELDQKDVWQDYAGAELAVEFEPIAIQPRFGFSDNVAVFDAVYLLGSYRHDAVVLLGITAKRNNRGRGYAEGALYAKLLGGVQLVSFADLNLNAFEEVVAMVDRV